MICTPCNAHNFYLIQYCTLSSYHGTRIISPVQVIVSKYSRRTGMLLETVGCIWMDLDNTSTLLVGKYLEFVFANCCTVTVERATGKHSKPVLDDLNAGHMSFSTLAFHSCLTLCSTSLKLGYLLGFLLFLKLHKPLCGYGSSKM